MNVKERLIQYIKFKELTNSEFCRSIGVSAAFISSMVKSMQPDKIERITLNYPDLNTGWLLTGEGEMLKESKAEQVSVTPDNQTIDRLLSIIESQQRTIENLTSKNKE